MTSGGHFFKTSEASFSYLDTIRNNSHAEICPKPAWLLYENEIFSVERK